MDEERETVMSELGYNRQSMTGTQTYQLRRNGNEGYNGSPNSRSLPEGLVRVRYLRGGLSGETKILAERFADDLIQRGVVERDKDQTKH